MGRTTTTKVAPAARVYTRRLPREHVSEAQRMRIIAAVTELACEDGAESIAVSRVIGLAGVSRRTFYELFEDRGHCLLAAIEQALELMGERAGAAYGEHERWVDGVRAGLLELLALCDQEPRLARLTVVQSAAAGPAALECRREVLARLARVVDRVRAAADRRRRGRWGAERDSHPAAQAGLGSAGRASESPDEHDRAAVSWRRRGPQGALQV
jgi:AcrR family transcriptional regulator